MTLIESLDILIAAAEAHITPDHVVGMQEKARIEEALALASAPAMRDYLLPPVRWEHNGNPMN